MHRFMQWWKQFKARHIVDSDRHLWGETPKPEDVFPTPVLEPRVRPWSCFRPRGIVVKGRYSGSFEKGILVKAQNDGAAVAVLLAFIADQPYLEHQA